MTRELLKLQLDLQQSRTPYAMATVVEVTGSSSAPPASRAVFDASGCLLLGWIGGGCAQAMVAHAALECLNDGRTRLVDVDLSDEIFGAGMPCGGSMRVFVEPVLPNPKLWLLGRGALVKSLCELAVRMEFDVIVDDALASAQAFPSALRIISDDCRYEKLRPEPGDFVVIATHHKGDYEALRQVLASKASYVAVVASRKRASLVLGRLAQEGFSAEDLARIRTPAGLAIGAKLPQEIALSIVGEMVQRRRQPSRALQQEPLHDEANTGGGEQTADKGVCLAFSVSGSLR